MTEREILFRGKRTDNEKWVEGYVDTAFTIDENRKVKSRHFTALDSLGWSSQVIVSDETVGQYTGLTDKNDVKIFEGDIVKGIAYSAERIGVIVWIDEIASFGVRYCKSQNSTAWENSSILRCASIGKTDQFAAEIIGNIHDNPELLETTTKPADKNIAQSGLAPATENFELMEG